LLHGATCLLLNLSGGHLGYRINSCLSIGRCPRSGTFKRIASLGSDSVPSIFTSRSDNSSYGRGRPYAFSQRLPFNGVGCGLGCRSTSRLNRRDRFNLRRDRRGFSDRRRLEGFPNYRDGFCRGNCALSNPTSTRAPIRQDGQLR
jgi:hypothetical protein